MLLSAARSNDMIITVEDFHRSIAVMEATEVDMPMTFKGLGKSSNADTLNRLMGFVYKEGTVDMETVMQHFYQDADAHTMDNLVRTLESMGSAEVVISGKKRFIKVTDKELARLKKAEDEGLFDK